LRRDRRRRLSGKFSGDGIFVSPKSKGITRFLIECGFDFDSHIVRGIIEAAASIRIPCITPMPAYDGEQNLTLCDSVLDRLNEIQSGFNIIDIKKKLVGVERLPQCVE